MLFFLSGNSRVSKVDHDSLEADMVWDLVLDNGVGILATDLGVLI